MKKIVINECFICPHIFRINIGTEICPNTVLACDKANKDIKDGFKIPTWCPLPDDEHHTDTTQNLKASQKNNDIKDDSEEGGFYSRNRERGKRKDDG